MVEFIVFVRIKITDFKQNLLSKIDLVTGQDQSNSQTDPEGKLPTLKQPGTEDRWVVPNHKKG